jgi:3-hydroxybutyrate dehydrogenase
MTIKAKTAVVTGSTSGIGLGIAHALASAGANIVMNGLGSEKDNQKVIAEVAAHGTRVSFDPANMLRHNQIADMIGKAEREFGPSTSSSTMPAFSTSHRWTHFRSSNGTPSLRST